MAISAIPIVFGGFLSGIISGALLQEFCPEDGEEGDCYMVWIIIGLVSSTAVFFTIIFRGCIEERTYDPEPFCPCFAETRER